MLKQSKIVLIERFQHFLDFFCKFTEGFGGSFFLMWFLGFMLSLVRVMMEKLSQRCVLILSLCFLSLYLRYSLCTVIFTLFCVQTCLLFLVQDVEVTAFDSVECRVIHNSVFSIN